MPLINEKMINTLILDGPLTIFMGKKIEIRLVISFIL